MICFRLFRDTTDIKRYLWLFLHSDEQERIENFRQDGCFVEKIYKGRQGYGFIFSTSGDFYNCELVFRYYNDTFNFNLDNI